MIKREKLSYWPLAALPFVAVIGIFDAGYLTVKHFAGSPVACSLLEGCEVVLTSEYAVLLGVPLSLLGLLYYVTIFTLAALALTQASFKFKKMLAWFSWIGLLSSAYLIYLQGFVIGAWCQYCLLSAVTSTLIWVLAQVMYFYHQKTVLPADQNIDE